MMDTKITHAYTATCRGCEKCVAGQIEDPERLYEVASAVQEWISRGWTVERQELRYGVYLYACECSSLPAPATGGQAE